MSTTSPVSSSPARKKVTTRTFRQKKLAGQPITILTAYDTRQVISWRVLFGLSMNIPGEMIM